MFALGKDLAAFVFGTHALTNTSVTAGGAGDNTPIVGTSLDKSKVPGRCNGACFAIGAEASLAATETLVLKDCKVEHSDDNVVWTDYDTTPETILTLGLTNEFGGINLYGAGLIQVDLTKTKQYVRATVTPDMSAAGADTALVSGVVLFHGADEVPKSSAEGFAGS